MLKTQSPLNIVDLLITGIMVVVLAVGAYMVAKTIANYAQFKKAQRAYRKDKFRPDGQPYPPSDRGICNTCGQAFEKVYFLEANQRACPQCYQQLEKES